MLRKMRKLLGQSTLEYAVLIVIIALALLGTQSYIKRGLQGRLRQSADDMGDQFSAQAGNIRTESNSQSRTTESTTPLGKTRSELLGQEQSNRITMTNVLGNVDLDYVGLNADGL